jgi:uncharacterized protein
VSTDPHRMRNARRARKSKSNEQMDQNSKTFAGRSDARSRSALRAFDYDGVTLLSGRFRRQVEQAVETYGSLPDDSILHGFRKHAGMPAPGEPMRGWCATSSSVIFGQLLSGLVRLGKATGEATLVQKAIRLFEGWRQTLPAPGHAGMRPYDWEKLVCGLVDLYAFGGHEPALSTLADTTEWAASTFDRSRVAADVHDFWGAGPGDTQEWYTLPENLYRAYQLTGDARFKSFADLWLYEDYWRPFAETTSPDRVVPVHAYSHVNSFSSAAMAYVVSGDDRYRRICENAYDFLLETQCYATGGYGPDERLMPPDGSLGRSLDRFCYHAEIPCGAWAGFKLARYLMSFTGEARYGDWMETLLLNAMGAALPTRPDGNTYYYGEYGIAAGRKQFYWHEWPCCSGTYLQNVAEYHNLVFFQDAEGLCVNLYVPAELQWDRDGTPIAVRLETAYPEAPLASIRLDMAEPAEFRLRFRIPGWCQGAGVQVNGEAVDVPAAPGRWAAVERLWNSGDRVTVTLPMSLRTVPVDRQHPDRVAVMYGPVVLAQDEACCRRPLAIGRATRLSSRLVQDRPGLRFRLINAMPERHTRHLVPLYDLPPFWPYWIYFDLYAEALY